MLNIRKQTFETNSSSTHAICITREPNILEIPDKIYIDLDDYQFGWENSQYTGYHNKLSYIFIGISKYREMVSASEKISKLIVMLQEIGVKEIEIKGLYIEIFGSSEKPYFNIDNGYVDHSNGMYELINILLEDKNLLKRYLFDRDSFIATGNDNDDEKIIDEEIIKQTHSIYWKGN